MQCYVPIFLYNKNDALDMKYLIKKLKIRDILRYKSSISLKKKILLMELLFLTFENLTVRVCVTNEIKKISMHHFDKNEKKCMIMKIKI